MAFRVQVCGMNCHVLVAMGPTEASEDALEYAFREHPDAEISVIHVTATSDPLGLFGDRDPSEYLVPECDVELDAELIPDETPFHRAQRRGRRTSSNGPVSSRTPTDGRYGP